MRSLDDAQEVDFLCRFASSINSMPDDIIDDATSIEKAPVGQLYDHFIELAKANLNKDNLDPILEKKLLNSLIIVTLIKSKIINAGPQYSLSNRFTINEIIWLTQYIPELDTTKIFTETLDVIENCRKHAKTAKVLLGSDSVTLSHHNNMLVSTALASLFLLGSWSQFLSILVACFNNNDLISNMFIEALFKHFSLTSYCYDNLNSSIHPFRFPDLLTNFLADSQKILFESDIVLANSHVLSLLFKVLYEQENTIVDLKKPSIFNSVDTTDINNCDNDCLPDEDMTINCNENNPPDRTTVHLFNSILASFVVENFWFGKVLQPCSDDFEPHTSDTITLDEWMSIYFPADQTFSFNELCSLLILNNDLGLFLVCLSQNADKILVILPTIVSIYLRIYANQPLYLCFGALILTTDQLANGLVDVEWTQETSNAVTTMYSTFINLIMCFCVKDSIASTIDDLIDQMIPLETASIWHYILNKQLLQLFSQISHEDYSIVCSRLLLNLLNKSHLKNSIVLYGLFELKLLASMLANDLYYQDYADIKHKELTFNLVSSKIRELSKQYDNASFVDLKNSILENHEFLLNFFILDQKFFYYNKILDVVVDISQELINRNIKFLYYCILYMIEGYNASCLTKQKLESCINKILKHLQKTNGIRLSSDDFNDVFNLFLTRLPTFSNLERGNFLATLMKKKSMTNGDTNINCQKTIADKLPEPIKTYCSEYKVIV